MPHQVSPYYSKTGAVYHIYGVCTAGKAIKRGRKVKGTLNELGKSDEKSIWVGQYKHDGS